MHAIHFLSELISSFERRRWRMESVVGSHAARAAKHARGTSIERSSAKTTTKYQRIEGFERDYPAFLISLAASIRTGLDPISALHHLCDLFPAHTALGAELRKMVEIVERGGTEEEAVAAFGAQIGHPDVPLFRSAFMLSRREGSSLGHCLERLASVTRARQSFRRKSKAAVAMQRLSAFGIAGCAVLIGFMQVAANVDAIKIALNHPVGSRLLMLGILLVVTGVFWMVRLTRVRV